MSIDMTYGDFHLSLVVGIAVILLLLRHLLLRKSPARIEPERFAFPGELSQKPPFLMHRHAGALDHPGAHQRRARIGPRAWTQRRPAEEAQRS